MSKITKMKLELAKMIAQFSKIKTDKAILEWPDEVEIHTDLEVYVLDENEVYQKAADGEYVLEDGRIVVVTNGIVTEIKEKEAEVKVEETLEDEPIKETDTDAIDAIRKEINELFEMMKLVNERLDKVENELTESGEIITKMSKMSAASNAEKEIEKAAYHTGDENVDRKLNNFTRK